MYLTLWNNSCSLLNLTPYFSQTTWSKYWKSLFKNIMLMSLNWCDTNKRLTGRTRRNPLERRHTVSPLLVLELHQHWLHSGVTEWSFFPHKWSLAEHRHQLQRADELSESVRFCQPLCLNSKSLAGEPKKFFHIIFTHICGRIFALRRLAVVKQSGTAALSGWGGKKKHSRVQKRKKEAHN